MSRRLRFYACNRVTLLCGALLALSFAMATPAQAASPKWRVASLADSGTVSPNPSFEYLVNFYNAGSAPTDGSPIEVSALLPPGMSSSQAILRNRSTTAKYPCSGTSAVHCTVTGAISNQVAAGFLTLELTVSVDAGLSGSRVAVFSITGGGAPTAELIDPTRVSATAPQFGIDAFDMQVNDQSGAVSTAAGRHPFATITNFDFNSHTEEEGALRGFAWPVEPFRDGGVDLPPGLLGNPSVMARCTLAQLSNSATNFVAQPLCPSASQVGNIFIRDKGIADTDISIGPLPIFNLVPSPGSPASFGFNVFGTVIVLNAHLRSGSGSGYFVSIEGQDIPQGLAIEGNRIEFWGEPAAEIHDSERACPGESSPFEEGNPSAPAGCPAAYTRPEHQAFLRNPTACTEPGQGLTTYFHADSWVDPGARSAFDVPELSDPAWKTTSSTSHEAPGYPFPNEPAIFPESYTGPTEWGPAVGIEKCEAEPFEPGISVRPTTDEADSPSGLDVSLRMPQHGLLEPEAISESDLKNAEVVLPEGLTIDPSAAAGQGACSETQVGLLAGSSHPFEFNEEPQHCPDSSKIGTVELESPLLAEGGSGADRVLSGAVYLAKQAENPFGSLLAMYLVVEDPQTGVTLKLPGRIAADPSTGRLTTTFDENPQLPFEVLRLHLFGGPRAALRTPPSCGSYAAKATLTGWSGALVEEESAFQITSGPSGTPCPPRAFSPKLEAGTQNPLAGTFSPFSLRLTREDGSPEISSLTAALPEGLLGKLKGVTYCPQSTLAALEAAEQTLGTAAAQVANPSCPASSQIGTITVGAGSGPNPFLTSLGHLYLAGPYKGAPYSLVAVVPALAGPFDLGTVLVRNAVDLNHETTAIKVGSDPFPRLLHGIPIDIRDLRVEVNRPEFTVNPTSCEPKAVNSTVTSTQGATASLSQRFQTADCGALPFKPKLSLSFKGKVNRTAHPSVIANVQGRPGDANIAHAQVKLPPSAFLDQAHIGTVCTRVQFAAQQCPSNSIYGKASATTPLLNYPLSGPVYLRSDPEHELPDLVVALRGSYGEQIEVDLAGRTDSVKGALRNTFEAVPDAPVGSFHLQLFGGKRGLIEMSAGFCAHPNATVKLTGQNGKVYDTTPRVGGDCGKGKPAKGKRGRS